MSIVQSGTPYLALLLASAIACLPSTAAAQNVTGTLAGTIVDEQGSLIPGASITVINELTADSRATVSDDQGNFQVTNLPPGTYTVRVEMANFRTAERTKNVLSAAERLSIGSLTLQVGGVGEVVTVESSGTHVNTAETQHSGLITSRQIEQIQVRSRDVTSLMRLVPGVRYEDNVEAMGDSFGTLIPHVGGQRRDWNTVMIDGVLGNEIGQANRLAQAINLDSIAEIKILLNTYRAEYGRTGGGQVQIISKSGGSQYAGNLYYYGRHEKLNANNFFNNRANRAAPRYRFNTYGANLGGPVPASKKLFFFYSLEAPITERAGSLLSWTMPTDAERRGDFSQTLDSAGRLIVIRDPQTGQPFPGNIIPADRINRNGQALLNLLPGATVFDRGVTLGNYNHQTQEIAENPRRNQVARVDWRPSANDSFYFTFKDWFSDQRGVGGAGGVTAGPAAWGWFQAHYLNTDRGGSANYTKIIRSNLINEAAFGVRAQTEQFHPLSEAEWDRAGRANAGYTLGQFHPELNPRNVLPKVTFNVTNPPNFTFDNRLAETGAPWLFSFRNDLTWVKGSHTFKGGMYWERLHNSEGKGGVGAGPWAGQFNFTVDTANPFDANHSFANALLGSFRDYTEIDAFPEVQSRRTLSRVVLPGHVEGQPAGDARPRYALPLLPAMVHAIARCGVRARTVRSGASAAPVSADARQQREPRDRSGDGGNAAEHLRRQLRAWHWGSIQRDGHQRRSELSARLPRHPGHRTATQDRTGMGHKWRRQDGLAHERWSLLQRAYYCAKHGQCGQQPAGGQHAEHFLRHDGHPLSGRGVYAAAE